MADDLQSAGSAAVSGAAAGASFGPYGMAIGAVAGLGLSLIGGLRSHSAASAYNDAQQQQIQGELAIQAKHKEAMEFDARRRDLQNLRRTQQAGAMGAQAAVSQGAQYGSGYAGGQAQVSSEGRFNAQGIAGNLAIGEDIFGLNAGISQQRIAMANAHMNMQTGAAISGFGGQVMGSLGPLGRLTSGFGAGSNPTSPGPYLPPTGTA